MMVDDAGILCDGDKRVRYVPSPNVSGALVKPEAIVIHYTAGRSLEKSIGWLTSKSSQASALGVVGRDTGEFVQLVPSNRIAWHAGTSKWRGRAHCNRWMLGLELDNFGLLSKHTDGLYYPQFAWRKDKKTGKRVFTGKEPPVPDTDIFVCSEGKRWHTFTEPQLLTAYRVSEALIDAYGSIHEVLGHSDVSPDRKIDPGPAFDMTAFRSSLLDRGHG